MAEIDPGRAEESRNLVTDLYFGTAERTFHESPLWADSYRKPYNPDDLFQKTNDYTIYEEMRRDDQVHVAMQLKIDLVLGSGWSIVAEDENLQPLADDIFSIIEEDPESCFDDDLENLIDDSYSFGFALAEKRFQIKNDNKLGFRSLRTRHPSTWLIHTDVHGNIEKYVQMGPSGDIIVDPKSLLHLKNSPRHSNPYGQSDLRKAYDPWFVKRHVTRYYSIYLEKAAGPMPVARYESKVPASKVTEIFNIIKRFQAKTAMAIPKEFEIEFLESKTGGDAYIKGLDLFNLFIGRSLMIPDLVGVSGQKTAAGSYALGKTQMELFFKHIHKRRRQLERIVNYHIIKPLVVWNYGEIPNFPKFKLNPISEEDANEFAKIFIEAIKGRLYKPTENEINYFRSLITFPEGDVEFFEEPTQQQPGMGGDGGEETEGEGNEPGTGEEKEVEAKFIVPMSHDKDKVNTNLFEVSPFKDHPGEYYKRVDFKAIGSNLDAGESAIVAEARPIIEDILADLFDQMQKKRIVSDPPHPERIDTIKLKYLKRLQILLKKHFSSQYAVHKSLARKELFKNEFAAPLPSDKFLEFLESETFEYIGDWEYQVTKAARVAMVQAIKDGKPLSSVIDMLNTEGKRDSLVSVERYSRTKGTEVMNRARLEEFEDSKVVHGYQYSAILDGRTTEICAGLHGKLFKKGTEPIPPMHFNCRSVLIPITIFESFEPDTKVGRKDIDKFIEDNKGIGFPKR